MVICVVEYLTIMSNFNNLKLFGFLHQKNF